MPKRSFLQRPLGYPTLRTSRFKRTPHFVVEIQELILQFCSWQDRFRLYMAGVLIPGGHIYNIVKNERNRQLQEVIMGLKNEALFFKEKLKSINIDNRSKSHLTRIVKKYDHRICMAEKMVAKD